MENILRLPLGFLFILSIVISLFIPHHEEMGIVCEIITSYCWQEEEQPEQVIKKEGGRAW